MADSSSSEVPSATLPSAKRQKKLSDYQIFIIVCLIEASMDPLVTIGRDGKIMDVNGATKITRILQKLEMIFRLSRKPVGYTGSSGGNKYIGHNSLQRIGL